VVVLEEGFYFLGGGLVSGERGKECEEGEGKGGEMEGRGMRVPMCNCTFSCFSTWRPQYNLLYPSDFLTISKISFQVLPAGEVGSSIEREVGMERMSICVGSAILKLRIFFLVVLSWELRMMRDGYRR
jgi:hypothetical protein